VVVNRPKNLGFFKLLFQPWLFDKPSTFGSQTFPVVSTEICKVTSQHLTSAETLSV